MGRAAPRLRLQPSRLGEVVLRGGVAPGAPYPVLVACAAGMVAFVAVAVHGMAQPAACYRDSAGALGEGNGPVAGTISGCQGRPLGFGSPHQLAVIAMLIWPSAALNSGGASGGIGAGGERRGDVGNKRAQEVGAGPHTPASATRIGTVAGCTTPRHVADEGTIGRGCIVLLAMSRRWAGGGGAARARRKCQERGEVPGRVPAAAVPRRSWGAGRVPYPSTRARRGASVAPALAGNGLKCPGCAPPPIARVAGHPCAQCRHM